ncbi:MAG TPA: DUF1549 domain-containing protein, partial [Pirellula sp.]|nr:DUF1549 domain-containing protein [Pirellula sp.]
MSCYRYVWSFALVAFVLSKPSPVRSQNVSFERDIRPILRQYCIDCHGATEKKEGKLDLRLVRFMKLGGDSGPAIAVGKASESLLIQRVVDGEMPPGESHLPTAQLEILRKWIDAGSKTERNEPEQIGPGIPITVEDRDYWAYRPIVRPPVPDFPSQDRIRTPIDALLFKAMPAGISFSPDADRETLIRRVYFDLIGLPPNLDEFDRWNNLQDCNWFEQLVDSLLESPQYGERWSRHWLDVAGYADS